MLQRWGYRDIVAICILEKLFLTRRTVIMGWVSY